MTPYTLALIGLRLIIVFITLNVIATQSAWLFQSGWENDVTFDWRDIVLDYFLTVAVVLLMATAFWLLTRRAARFLVSGHDDKGDVFGIEGKQLLAVFLAVIGAYFFIWNFPGTVVGIFRLTGMETGYATPEDYLQVGQSAFVTFLSLLFMFMGHRIASWISLFSRRPE